jgi:hypothetical protein
MEMSGQVHAPVVLPRAEGSQYPLDRKLGEPLSRSGRGNKEKKNPDPAGDRTLVTEPVA